MPLLDEASVCGFYQLFNGNRPNPGMIRYFRSDATYRQTNTGIMVSGHRAIGWVLEGWKVSFTRVLVTGFKVVEQTGAASLPSGAAKSFQVSYVFTGQYLSAFFGGERMPPARGQMVEFGV